MLHRTVRGLVCLVFLHQSGAFLTASAPRHQEEGKKGSTGQTETRAFASVETMKNSNAGAATSKANGVSAETLKEWAKNVVKHDMGLKDEDLLDDSFYFIGPFDGPVGKRPFVDGSKTFDLRGAFPDFEFNEHDFRVDDVQPMRVWLTTRKTGTHQGDLPMYGKLIKPTGRKLDSPPETYSCTFNEQGKCIKLTGGFVMDAMQGTSGGLGGPLGIAKAVGHPRPIFSHEPPVKALRELAARAFRKGADRAPYMPPTEAVMPEEELKALAMTVLVDEDMGRHNADRLAPDFTFYDPLIGVLDRKTYTSWYLPSFDLKASFPDDLEVLAYNVRVEEGNRGPCTVWVTMRTSGTHTGAAFGSGPLKGPPNTGLHYVSPPEAVSLTFNKDRQLTRLTVGAVMDREEGNTCGLGGIHGVRYALGRPSSPLLTRPFRFQNKNEWAQSMRALASPVVDTVTHLASKLSKNRQPTTTTDATPLTEPTATAMEAEQAMKDVKMNNTNALDDVARGKKQNDAQVGDKNGSHESKGERPTDVEMITAKVS